MDGRSVIRSAVPEQWISSPRRESPYEHVRPCRHRSDVRLPGYSRRYRGSCPRNPSLTSLPVQFVPSSFGNLHHGLTRNLPPLPTSPVDSNSLPVLPPVGKGGPSRSPVVPRPRPRQSLEGSTYHPRLRRPERDPARTTPPFSLGCCQSSVHTRTQVVLGQATTTVQ